MQINPAIFKAYDIRGICPKDLNGEAAYQIGRAFVSFLEKTDSEKSGPLKIVVGRDNRLSSPLLSRNLIKGMIDAGADVTDIGLATTPMLYFAVVKYRCDGGVVVTASHNPKEYNGFKLVRRDAVPISEESGIREIQRLSQSPFPKGKIGSRTTLLKQKVVQEYAVINTRGVDKNDLQGLKIVIDTANAVSGMVIPAIFKDLPCKITHLFKKSDGSFPNHSPDPLQEQNLETLRSKVVALKADLGVAFDGDGDRIIFLDEQGGVVSGNLISALMSDLILKEQPGEKILYDVRSSNVIKETIQASGGTPVMWRIGHSFIKEKMRQDKIIFASELSGHYYHRDHYFCEAPFFVLFRLLRELGKKSLSELVNPYKKYWHSGEINFKIADKKAAMELLKKRYSDGRILTIDGLRVDYDDWWFLARPSNTEPVLRLVIEAKTKELMDKKKEELSALLH